MRIKVGEMERRVSNLRIDTKIGCYGNVLQPVNNVGFPIFT